MRLSPLTDCNKKRASTKRCAFCLSHAMPYELARVAGLYCVEIRAAGRAAPRPSFHPPQSDVNEQHNGQTHECDDENQKMKPRKIEQQEVEAVNPLIHHTPPFGSSMR